LSGFDADDPWRTAIPLVSKWESSEFLDKISYVILVRGGNLTVGTSDGAGFSFIDFPHTLNTGEWSQIATTFDAGRLKVYQDATVLIDTVLTTSSINNSTERLLFGNWCKTFDNPGCRTLSGLLDEVRYYNFALDSLQITALRNRTLFPPCCEIAGDADSNGGVNIADITFLIKRIFSNGSPPECNDQADANGDNSVNIADVTHLISWIFGGSNLPICGTTGN